MNAHVTVVGIGSDGWDGLPATSRALVEGATTVFGGRRHLDLVPQIPGQERIAWPSPLRTELPALLAQARGPVLALASGDPLVSGIGTTLIDLLGSRCVTVVPAVSSVALARARLRWPAESHGVVSLVGRDVRLVVPALSAGRRVLVLSSDGSTPAAVAELLVDLGWGDSRLVVLGDLDGPDESRTESTAREWNGAAAPRLHVLAVEVGGAGPGWAAGGVLPDDAFEHSGQITKRDLRASALARLAPAPGQLLWDVGAGSGSVGVEWMRTWPSARAIAIEPRADRAALVRRNAVRHGVPGLQVVEDVAPRGVAGLDAPDAVFVGGGATVDGVLDTCWSALRPGGRLVVHAVTAETEGVLLDRYRRHGGELVRFHVERAEPLGTFTGWTPSRAVSQWSIVKGDS